MRHVAGVTVFLGANVETIASDLQTDLTTILAVWLVLVLLLEVLLEGLALWTSSQGTYGSVWYEYILRQCL